MYRFATITTLLCLSLALPASDAVAQQMQHVSFKSPAENNKFTQQLNIDVGDAPNHIVRIFEVRGTYPNNPPVINGLKLAESWARGIGDRIDGNGPATQYNVFVMENGDRFFSRINAIVQTASGNFTSTQVGPITGGTGQLAAIHGTVRIFTTFNFNTGFNESQYDIEYSMGK